MDNKPLNRIKVMMAERMITNKELGKLLGKDTLENLIEIAKVLKCDIGDLVRKDDSIVIDKQKE